MCTLSFVPSSTDYRIAMNRDESRARPIALPPEIRRDGQATLLFPRETSGGTWVAVNSFGNTLALLNWYSIPLSEAGEKLHSRGVIIPRAAALPDFEATLRFLSSFDFSGFHPFRLFGFFADSHIAAEWRWDGQQLESARLAWRRTHRFSSSLSDERAALHRGAACEEAAQSGISQSGPWLRTLHASHVPSPGPFSVCVHREDAATVSYTEIHVDTSATHMRYFAGNPCECSGNSLSLTIPRSAPIASHYPSSAVGLS